jgi:hypothetical protein
MLDAKLDAFNCPKGCKIPDGSQLPSIPYDSYASTDISGASADDMIVVMFLNNPNGQILTRKKDGGTWGTTTVSTGGAKASFNDITRFRTVCSTARISNQGQPLYQSGSVQGVRLSPPQITGGAHDVTVDEAIERIGDDADEFMQLQGSNKYAWEVINSQGGVYKLPSTHSATTYDYHTRLNSSTISPSLKLGEAAADIGWSIGVLVIKGYQATNTSFLAEHQMHYEGYTSHLLAGDAVHHYQTKAAKSQPWVLEAMGEAYRHFAAGYTQTQWNTVVNGIVRNAVNFSMRALNGYPPRLAITI